MTARLSGRVRFDTGAEVDVSGEVLLHPAPTLPVVESVTLSSDQPELVVTPTDDPLVFKIAHEG